MKETSWQDRGLVVASSDVLPPKILLECGGDSPHQQGWHGGCCGAPSCQTLRPAALRPKEASLRQGRDGAVKGSVLTADQGLKGKRGVSEPDQSPVASSSL